MATTDLADAGSLIAAIHARPALRLQLGDTAHGQLLQLAASPCLETAETLNSIWVRTVFPLALAGLLKDAPACWREVRAAMAALERVPHVPPADNSGVFTGPMFDTLEEQRGDR